MKRIATNRIVWITVGCWMLWGGGIGCATSSDAESAAMAEAHNNHGVASIVNGDYDKAIEHFSKAIGFHPTHAKSFCNRGIAYRLKGDHDRAIEDLNEAIDLEPDSGKAYYCRAVVHSDRGNKSKADADFSKAEDLGFEPSGRETKYLSTND